VPPRQPRTPPRSLSGLSESDVTGMRMLMPPGLRSLGSTGAPLLGTAGSAHETAGGRWADGCRSYADWGPGPPAPGWHVSQRFVNAEGFPIVLIPPALLGVPPLLSPFAAQLASLGDPGRPASGRIAFQQNRRALRPAGTEAASPECNLCVISFHPVGGGKLRGGQPSNSRLVLYFDVVTRRPPYSAFSSARSLRWLCA